MHIHQFTHNNTYRGTYSGQVVLWDTRAKSLPVQRTPLSANGRQGMSTLMMR